MDLECIILLMRVFWQYREDVFVEYGEKDGACGEWCGWEQKTVIIGVLWIGWEKDKEGRAWA